MLHDTGVRLEGSGSVRAPALNEILLHDEVVPWTQPSAGGRGREGPRQSSSAAGLPKRSSVSPASVELSPLPVGRGHKGPGPGQDDSTTSEFGFSTTSAGTRNGSPVFSGNSSPPAHHARAPQPAVVRASPRDGAEVQTERQRVDVLVRGYISDHLRSTTQHSSDKDRRAKDPQLDAANDSAVLRGSSEPYGSETPRSATPHGKGNDDAQILKAQPQEQRQRQAQQPMQMAWRPPPPVTGNPTVYNETLNAGPGQGAVPAAAAPVAGGPPAMSVSPPMPGNGVAANPRDYRDYNPQQPNGQWGGNSRGAYYGPRREKKALGKFRRVLCFTVSHQWHHTLFLAAIIIAVGLIFLISVVPHGEVYSYVIVAVFMALSLFCLFMSVLIDPGIVPPQAPSLDAIEPEFVDIRGTQVECLPCRTCNIIRPPRSTHCQFCDVCVEEFDHHCGVLGSCVGRRTYRFFGGFFIMTTVVCIYIFIRSIISLVPDTVDGKKEPVYTGWPFIAAILCIVASFFGGCFVIPFSGMYIQMACLETTQKEVLRLGPNGHCVRNRPYSTNPCTDCLRRFLGPLGHTKIEKDYFV